MTEGEISKALPRQFLAMMEVAEWMVEIAPRVD